MRGDLQHGVRRRVDDQVAGLELARAVRSIKPGVPVLVSSGAGASKTEQQRLAEIQALGVSAIMDKPHTAAELLSAVAAALRVK